MRGACSSSRTPDHMSHSPDTVLAFAAVQLDSCTLAAAAAVTASDFNLSHVFTGAKRSASRYTVDQHHPRRCQGLRQPSTRMVAPGRAAPVACTPSRVFYLVRAHTRMFTYHVCDTRCIGLRACVGPCVWRVALGVWSY